MLKAVQQKCNYASQKYLEVCEIGSIWWQGRIDAGYPNAGLEINWAWGPDSRLGACVVEKFSLSCASIIREPPAKTTPATMM